MIVPVEHVEPVPRRVRTLFDGQVVVDTAVRVGVAGLGQDALGPLVDTVRLRWDALVAWYEEDEEVFVKPRSPSLRVDAAPSTRTVTVALDGVVLAEPYGPVLVFETGLPTRHYAERDTVAAPCRGR